MFARRRKRDFRQSVRHAVWPKRGHRRSATYLWHRLMRLSASPHQVAAGAAAGAFAAFSPLIGLHVFIGLGLAWILRGNLVAAAIATLVANPLTLPIMLTADYELGRLLLGGSGSDTGASDVAVETLALAHLWPLLGPMLAGWAVLGIAGAAVTYACVRPAVQRVRSRRRTKRLPDDTLAGRTS